MIQENIKHVNVPVDKVVERKVPVEKLIEKVVEVPRDRIVEVPIERIVEVPIEKIVEVQIPVEKRIEVPVDRVVEVPVERQVEEVVLIESEPVFETRQRRVQVPVTVMQEQVRRAARFLNIWSIDALLPMALQVIEEQVQVGYRQQPVQERIVTSGQQYASQPRSVQYVERQRPEQQYVSTAGQYSRQYASSESLSYSPATAAYGATTYQAASYASPSYVSRSPYSTYASQAAGGERVYSRGTAEYRDGGSYLSPRTEVVSGGSYVIGPGQAR